MMAFIFIIILYKSSESIANQTSLLNVWRRMVVVNVDEMCSWWQ